jgi:hypothetical protein
MSTEFTSIADVSSTLSTNTTTAYDCYHCVLHYAVLQICEVLLHEAGGVGENGGWYTMDNNHELEQFAPLAYHEEIIV